MLLEGGRLDGGLSPQVRGEEGVGALEGVVGGLDEVAEGLGVTGGLSEHVLDTGVGKHLLGGGTSNETGTLGGGHEADSD